MKNSSLVNNSTLPTQLPLWRCYLELCKPKVVVLMLITCIVGMLLASPHLISLNIMCFGLLGIGLAAGSAAAINHVVDQHADAIMRRTKQRPLPTGKVSSINALIFAVVMGVLGLSILTLLINPLTAFLTFLSLMGYAVLYTMFLKRATPQNIVIGGLAGAAPPLLGWTAVTGHIDPNSLLLVLIIFAWTPPHFWALAIFRHEDYAKVEIPMLPVTHGIAYTKLNIVFYTFLLLSVSLLPYVTGMSGIIYLIGALILGVRFLYWSFVLNKTEDMQIAMKTFRFSINYLFLLFILLLIDHYLMFFALKY